MQKKHKRKQKLYSWALERNKGNDVERKGQEKKRQKKIL